MGTGRKTSNREPRACFRGFPNAIGNAIGALLGVSALQRWLLAQQTRKTLQSDTVIY